MLQNQINLADILFLDIETIPAHADFQELSAEERALWEEKTQYQRQNSFTAEEFYDRSGIFAEFGKIICISVGFFHFQNGKRQFRVRSFWGEEKKILIDFSTLLDTYFKKKYKLLCAHNGKEFDFPYIGRRMIINRLPIPEILNLSGKKPWEIPHLDTMELWKFGDYKHFTSLKLLTFILGIPSPKEDIDGKDVRRIFYEENNINRIVSYCERDTIAVAQVFLRLKGEEILQKEEILFSKR